jgi:hypothetical protein
MSTDLEELVRQGMHRLAETTGAPTGLVGRARRSVRRRQLAAGSAVAGAAAAVTAIAVVTAGGRRARPRPYRPPLTWSGG